ncbi:hypothetical protein GQ600_23216 [Phytophthora cactorum]|nr:hypothetical protein GQ600_23216 [Phytophthora cactorum]
MPKGTTIAPRKSSGSTTRQSLQSTWTNKTGGKLNQIVPTGPTADELKLESRRILGRAQDGALAFGQVFGLFGAPMLLILLVCIAWTSWLIFLALVPNKAANLLMDTSSYDNGQFWLFNDANPHLILAGAIGLVVVDFCYLFVTLRMLLWRDKLFGSALSESASQC